MSMLNFVYDFESGSADPHRTQPLQFAGVDTDEDYKVVSDPIEIFTRPAVDFPVSLQAIAVNRLKLDDLLCNGLSEFESSKKINELLTRPNTVSIAYNGTKFDEELVRFCNWRNFLPAYDFEWRNGCSRFDPFPLVKLMHAIMPEAISVPVLEDGRPSFRLENLCLANGISNGVAHNAVTDVLNLAGFLALLKRNGGDVFKSVFAQRGKFQAKDVLERSSAVLVSGRYDEKAGVSVFPATFLCVDPDQPTRAFVWDLRKDVPHNFNVMSDGQISELGAFGNVDNPIVSVKINKAPAFVPMDRVDPSRLLDLYGMGSNAFHIRANEVKKRVSRSVVKRIADVCAFPAATDVDRMLYDGFVPNEDRMAISRARALVQSAGDDVFPKFVDTRLGELLDRLYCRTLSGPFHAALRERWRDRLAEVWFTPDGEGQVSPWAQLKADYLGIVNGPADDRSDEMAGYLVYAQRICATLTGLGILRPDEALESVVSAETAARQCQSTPEGSDATERRARRSSPDYVPSF